MSVKIYVEGGGVGELSLKRCQDGFRRFFERLLPGKEHVRVRPCGGRADAWRDFKIANDLAKPGEYVILLVDSEGPVGANISAWDYLWGRKEDKWEKPKEAEDDQAHLMVQCMEAWFMADREAAVKHLGKNVKVSDLPAPVNNDIECLSKDRIIDALNKAARKARKLRGGPEAGI